MEISQQLKDECKEKLNNIGDTISFTFNPRDKEDYMRQVNAIRYQGYKRNIRLGFTPEKDTVNGVIVATVNAKNYKGPKSPSKKSRATLPVATNSNIVNTPTVTKRNKSKYPVQPFVKMSSSEFDTAFEEAKTGSKVEQTIATLSKPKESFFVPKEEMTESLIRQAVSKQNQKHKGSKKFSCNKLKYDGRDIGYKITLSKVA